MSATEPLFTLDGGRFVPSEHTRGPWEPRPGPARAWFRLHRAVVAGEEPTGLQRAAS